jgi:heme A synthase
MDATISTPTRQRSVLFSVLVGLTALAILLQAVWAGIFIREGQDNNDHWVNVHALGADVAIVLAILAIAVAFWQLRSRRDLILGTAALAVLLILEAYLGGLIGDHQDLEVIHFPLALVLMGLAVWLPFRARH